MDWIVANKEWLFSGIIVTVPLAIIGWVMFSKKNKQVQKGGKNSSNIQVGRDLNIKSGKNDD